MLPELDRMQAMLSQRGRLRKMMDTAGLPKWTPNTAFHKSFSFCKLPQGSKPQCLQVISSAASFLRPVHHFPLSGSALQGFGYSSASGLPLLSGIFPALLEIPVGETRPYRSYGPVKSVGSPSVGTVERTGLQRELYPLESSAFFAAHYCNN